MDQSNNDKSDPDAEMQDAPPRDANGTVPERTESGPSSPRANNFEKMKKRFLFELPDLEVLDEVEHTWEISNWNTLPQRETGPIFQCGGDPWQILFYPYGNNVDFASFYLKHGFDQEPPEHWYACVQFMLVLWNPNDPTIYTTHAANHRFTSEESDWGFTRFADLRKLFAVGWEGRERPMVENDCVNITAYLRTIKDPTGVLWHNFNNYDSKKETGMVGLKNQGATCYLNSLLQSLYFTTAFRKAVYQIPTETHEEKPNSAYALQRLFFLLQTNNQAVATNELTASFGWDSRQIFEQQDVQELSRILMERMEEKMKGTEAENALGKMMVGKMKTYISCINVNFESSRMEDFWDIQLNVRGNKNLDESFHDYIQVETMDGENKYFAEGHGLQDAKKGVIFESFPQVLHLQLKRFEYDFKRDAMMKVNDRYEFPEIWDASPYLSEAADQSEPYIYHLHGILVHSGDLNAGHYYAYIKPEKDGHYYKFDDDRVTRAMKSEALDENFGGDYTNIQNGYGLRNPYTRTWSTKRSMSAYMLVYIRKSRLDNILLDQKEVTPPEHLGRKFAEEKLLRERRQKEVEEAYLYMKATAVTQYNFKCHEGFDIVPWKEKLAISSKAIPKEYRILRSMNSIEFSKHVANDQGLNPEMVRPWIMVGRKNGTVRPEKIISPSMTLNDAAEKLSMTSACRIWLEETNEKDSEGNPVWGDSKVELHDIPNNRPVLLFLKVFDPEAQTLSSIGHFYAAQHDKVQDLSPIILKMMNWPSSVNFKIYEEIKLMLIEPMKSKATLLASEIQDGDILTVLKSYAEKETLLLQSGKIIDICEFYEDLHNRAKVKFYVKGSTPNVEDGNFELMLSLKMNYNQLAQKVADHLGVKSTHIRFWTVNQTTGRPRTVVRRLNTHLSDILSASNATGYDLSLSARADSLYYEVLDMSLDELETMKYLTVTWLPDGIIKEEIYEVFVAKHGNVTDVLSELQKKAKVTYEIIRNVIVFEVHACKVFREIATTLPVSSLNDSVGLFVERVPNDEFELHKGDKIVSCFHFDTELAKPYHLPFHFLVKEGEPLKDSKERLSKRIGIKGKQFEKIKFAVVQRSAYTKPRYLCDDDILCDKIDAADEHLGLDHVNKSRNIWNRADSIFIK